MLISEVARTFPDQTDNLLRLIDGLIDYDQIDEAASESAREVISQIITDPLLVEMLLCPLMYYGCARPRDMESGGLDGAAVRVDQAGTEWYAEILGPKFGLN